MPQYEELVDRIKKLNENQFNDLISIAKDWAILHGIGMRSKLNFSDTSINIAPFTLLPSPVPHESFQKAITVQPLLNELYHKLAYDPDFLQNSLKETIEQDDFTRRLFEIYETVRKEGFEQNFSLGLFRSDYLQHFDGSLKQVELNTIASSMAGLICNVKEVHRFIIKELDMEEHIVNLPENEALTKLCSGILEAWKLYDNESSAILFVVEDVTYNISDQRNMQFEINRLNRKAKVIRRSFTELSKEIRIGENMELFVGNLEVAVIYYRYGYDPDHYTEEEHWNVRLLLEKSKAIKCPSIHYHLVGSKKVQQVLCEPGVLEKYLPEKESVRLIREMFVSMYPLDKSAQGEEGYSLAMNKPEHFVLKPQREGGGNNIYGSDITKYLKGITREEAASYILMSLIEAPPSWNVLIRQESVMQDDTISELGVYGVVIGNSKQLIKNETAGHMVRSKSTKSQESGVAAGSGLLDSPYLLSGK